VIENRRRADEARHHPTSHPLWSTQANSIASFPGAWKESWYFDPEGRRIFGGYVSMGLIRTSACRGAGPAHRRGPQEWVRWSITTVPLTRRDALEVEGVSGYGPMFSCLERSSDSRAARGLAGGLDDHTEMYGRMRGDSATARLDSSGRQNTGAYRHPDGITR